MDAVIAVSVSVYVTVAVDVAVILHGGVFSLFSVAVVALVCAAAVLASEYIYIYKLVDYCLVKIYDVEFKQ